MLFRSDRKSTRLNSSHLVISYAVFCLKKKKKHTESHNIKLSTHADLRQPWNAHPLMHLRTLQSPRRSPFVPPLLSVFFFFFFLIIRAPPEFTPFPYTTLFR